ncbi:alpha/beta fold hydrolase [Nonomuraea gerenzanensis]|uniref:Proline iminopeptidase n=1 Tax=Nonomuraea gerenzanensis TaxID=93944 RepID=A0A1M4EHC4_9ACTN|nr:alpha/beta fold hydrolase [Nonomuraea gerenzanensis]UBU09554.1 alpha/beta hydrolase [Nonomuraea gerenzanensis]SBO97973.1 Proline iminopeptidase [Nonomuraea gerenzanensis]
MITATYTIPGMRVRDHVERVPLDWSDPGASITVFARELVDPARDGEDLPCLLYLQGGPGGKGPRPVGTSGWLGRALETYRVILLDQRGTGRSSRIDGRVMGALGAKEGADHLARFRADSIVADAEHLRKTVFGGRRWSTLGQSYGGFLTLTYLSNAPEGLSACYVAGGLPSLDPDAEEVYRRTYPRVAAKNAEFYRRYPHHAETTARLADRLAEGDLLLPDGDPLTVRRLQSLGIDFGMKPGYERMHWLLDEARPDDGGGLPETFLHQVLARSSYADNPLFAALQESIYGHGAGATAWAAQRERARHPAFAEDARPLLFTGEMIYPWMFEEIRALRPFRGAVELLAGRGDWPPLYDLDRLAANEVPVAAAVYFDDMYVDSGLQLDTASRVGNTQAWVTNEYEHDGIGEERVFARLTRLVRDLGGGLIDG